MGNRYIPVTMCLVMALVFLEFAVLAYGMRPDQYELKRVYTGFSAKDFEVPIPKDFKRQGPPDGLTWYNEFKPMLDDLELTYEITTIEKTNIGKYFITAYSPQETGSWGTASGTTLHRADYNHRLNEPTTCAIDRNLHRFGDLFYIEEFDRVFVAEDTGSAVKGKHLDLGYTDLASVWSFPTGYYTVYRVEYITESYTCKASDGQIIQEPWLPDTVWWKFIQN